MFNNEEPQNNNSSAPFNMPNRLNPDNIRNSQKIINATDASIRNTHSSIEKIKRQLSKRDSTLQKLDDVKKACLNHVECANRRGYSIPLKFKNISEYIEDTKLVFDGEDLKLAKYQEKLEQLTQKSKNLRNSQFKSGILVKRNRIKFNSFGGSTRKYRK
jgi:hypothetical protein